MEGEKQTIVLSDYRVAGQTLRVVAIKAGWGWACLVYLPFLLAVWPFWILWNLWNGLVYLPSIFIELIDLLIFGPTEEDEHFYELMRETYGSDDDDDDDDDDEGGLPDAT